jgi:dTDP-4-dehydrorhamnose reductase
LALQVPADYKVRFFSSGELDIRHWMGLAQTLDIYAPQLVINAAAYTAVDKAESDIVEAFAVNAQGPENLARWCAANGARLIHISTDFVFAGLANSPYKADAPSAPLNVYGRSKLAGEQAVLNLLPQGSVIIRCGWLYSAHGQNFLKTMLRLMAERDVLQVVHDQQGVPTSAASLAHIVWLCVADTELSGIVHWAEGGTASWYEFAAEIARQAYARGMLARMPEMNAISSAQYPTAARRPAYSVLNNEYLAQYFALRPQPWQAALTDVLDEFASIK